MIIKVKKLQMAPGQSARYYLNGLTGHPLRAKFWVEKGEGGNLILRIIDAHSIKLQQVLAEMLEAGQITQQEFDSPTIEIFDRISGSISPSSASVDGVAKDASATIVDTSNRLLLSKNALVKGRTSKIGDKASNMSSAANTTIITTKKQLTRKIQDRSVSTVVSVELNAPSKAISESCVSPVLAGVASLPVKTTLVISSPIEMNGELVVADMSLTDKAVETTPKAVETTPKVVATKEKPRKYVRKAKLAEQSLSDSSISVVESIITKMPPAVYSQTEIDLEMRTDDSIGPAITKHGEGSSNDGVLASKNEPIELSKPVTIIINNMSPKIIFDVFKAIKGVHVEKGALSVGDFVFSGGVIERKSAQDLTNSILDKSLSSQSKNISSYDGLRVVILEGDLYGIGELPSTEIDKAVSYLNSRRGFTVIRSESLRHTANLVAKIAFNATYEDSSEVSYE